MSSFNVYYTKPEHFRGFMMRDSLPKLSELTKTHTLLVEHVNAASPEHLYERMQAENWSPNGEARTLIENKGLGHTSMSVGDIIHNCDTDEWFVCDNIGFAKLEKVT